MTLFSRTTSPQAPARVGHRAPGRLTLVQMMVASTALAAVAMAAMPVHQKYLRERHAALAAADLSALDASLSDYLLRNEGAGPALDQSVLPVPSPVVSVALPTGTVTTTVSLMQQLYAQGWTPRAGEFYNYGASFDAKGYTLSATGKPGQACRLTLVVADATQPAPVRTFTAAKGPDCGLTRW
ncbi:hypothetical protein EC845_2840 [Comamonas sp. BIGb0124]|uniref:hypothetical protein n=1 Tax=Comamonas sp. BIGb0124 TaxID=2485130 RepID=UPI000F4A68BA|nr:hypothetical protein [Comamonas sp. BIGb0124]ROR20971.1 hypothetical protein EC845_2840 [Comamonas sp. BIGb0124]